MGLTPWATLFRPDKSGLTYGMNFSYGTPAPSSSEEGGLELLHFPGYKPTRQGAQLPRRGGRAAHHAMRAAPVQRNLRILSEALRISVVRLLQGQADCSEPTGAARILLTIISREPEAVRCERAELLGVPAP